MKQVAWIVFGWLALQTTEAASYDCEKAATKVEKHICGDAELSKLDEDLNTAYRHALERPDVKQQAIDSQKQWLKNARNVCQTEECIKAAYQKRISELGFTSSFGIVFLRPSDGNAPQQAAAKAPVQQTPLPSVEIPKAQIAEAKQPANGTNCGIPTASDIAKLPTSDAIARLVGISNAKLAQQQYECGVVALEEANRIILSVPDESKRAALGFDIKDVVFGMIEQNALPDISLEKRAIAAAVQSLDTNDNVPKSASDDERFNDAAFYGRVADAKCKEQTVLIPQTNCPYKESIIRMYQLDFSLPPTRHYVSAWQHQRYLQELNISEIANLWQSAPSDVRLLMENALGSRLGQTIQTYVLIGVELMSPEKAKNESEGLGKLQPAIDRVSAKQGDFWVWSIYRYAAEAYWQAGDKAKAREMLGKARDSINLAKAPLSVRSGAMTRLATSLCKLVRINGKVAQMCPIGIYDAKEMTAFLNETEEMDKAASDSYSLGTISVLRKRLPEMAK